MTADTDEYGIDESEIISWASAADKLPAVMLLMKAFDGDYFTAQYPWMVAKGVEGQVPTGHEGHSLVDFRAIPEHVGMVDDPKARRLLRVIASLADVGVTVDIARALAEMDRSHVELVLAAIAEIAAGYEDDEDAQPVYPWPQEA